MKNGFVLLQWKIKRNKRRPELFGYEFNGSDSTVIRRIQENL